MKLISDAEIEQRIRGWADVTRVSLDLKRAALRNCYPSLSEDTLAELLRKQLSFQERTG